MTSPIKLGKTYGVLHTESFFSFVGFAKKVASNKPQKVDVYVNDKLVDTIKANSFIQKIDDLYDVENSAFEYNLPLEYIGQKATISFKNHDSKEELLNSPYTLIDKNHEGFNEARFMHSLSEPLSEELKNMYKPNCVGFLATEENLEDVEFVEYINQIMQDFPNATFKALVFNNNQNTLIKEKFLLDTLELVELRDIYCLHTNIEVYLSNYDKTFANIYENSIVKYLRSHSTDIACIGLELNQQDVSVLQHEVNQPVYFKKFFNNLEHLGFEKEDIAKYGNSFNEVYFKKASEKYNIDIDFNLDESISKAYVYWNLRLGLYNHKFFQESQIFGKKFAKL